MNWIFFPRTESALDFINKTLGVFEKYSREIDSTKNDYEKIQKFIEVIYLTNKIKLDLKGIILVGY